MIFRAIPGAQRRRQGHRRPSYTAVRGHDCSPSGLWVMLVDAGGRPDLSTPHRTGIGCAKLLNVDMTTSVSPARNDDGKATGGRVIQLDVTETALPSAYGPIGRFRWAPHIAHAPQDQNEPLRLDRWVPAATSSTPRSTGLFRKKIELVGRPCITPTR